jgi:hypothetical protein
MDLCIRLEGGHPDHPEGEIVRALSPRGMV